MHLRYSHLLLVLGLLAGCTQKTPVSEAPAKAARTPVQVVTVQNGHLSKPLALFGTTVYLTRNVVTAPIAAFITGVSIRLGDKVQKGQALYTMETKERRALGNLTIAGDPGLLGRVVVRAPSSGTVTTFDKQQTGDYVLEGAQLCTIAENGALAIQVNVPFEYSKLAQAGSSCKIVLPDSSIEEARFTTALTTGNLLAQTQTILAQLIHPMALPENLTVEVQVNPPAAEGTQVLPKSALLSDEMMRQFWVMKLMSDSLAVRVNVVLGQRNEDQIEIQSPRFGPQDRIVSEGNYGLPDTAAVLVGK